MRGVYFVVKRGRGGRGLGGARWGGNETGEEAEGSCEDISVGGKRGRGRGVHGGGGGGAHTGHWTLNLCYRYFHPSDVSHRFGSHAADITLRDQLLYPTRGTLFDYTGLTF